MRAALAFLILPLPAIAQGQSQPPVTPVAPITLFQPSQPYPSDPTGLTTALVNDKVSTLEKSINGQLAAIIKNADEFKANLTHFPTEVDQKIGAAQSLQAAIIAGHVARIAEQFGGIKLQFDERDKRTELLAASLKDALNQAALAQTTAVNAALQAQKESASTQYSNLLSSLNELKATFGKLLDAQQTQIANVKDDGAKAVASFKDDTNRSIAALTNQVTAINSHSTGIGDSWGVFLAVAGLVGIVFGIGVALFRRPSQGFHRTDRSLIVDEQ